MSPGPRHTVWSSRSGTSRPMVEARRSASLTSSGRRSIRARSASWTVSGTAIPLAASGCSATARHSSSRKNGLPSALLRIAGASALCSPRGREETLDDALAVAPRERLERQLGRVGPVHPRRPVARAVREQREDGGARRGLDQRVEAFLRRAVDPLEILAHEHDRPLPAAPEAHLPEGIHGPGPDRLRREHAQPLGLLLHPEEVVQVDRPLLRVHPELLEPRAHLPGHRGRAVALRDVEAPPEDRDDGQVGNGAPVREAVALEPGDALAPEALLQLQEQAGLADPGLAHDAHDLAAPFDRNGEAIAQELELVAAAGEHGEPAARLEAAALDTLEPVRPRRRLQPVRGEDEREPPVEERGRRFGDDRSVGLGALEEPFQGIPGAALALELEPDLAPGVPDQKLRHVDAHAHGDPGRLGRAVALDRLADRDRGVRRPAGGVLDRLEAEARHDAGGAEVLNPAAEAPRLLDQRLDEPARVQPVVLGLGAVDDGSKERHAALLPADHRSRRILGGRRPRSRRWGVTDSAGAPAASARDGRRGRSWCLAIR